MIDISIIVPVYNAEKYLEKCLVSLLNQTLKNIEIIVVNDGSTDKSLEIALKLSKSDQRIKIYTQSNGGASRARNLGIKMSSGKYLGFVDADDYIKPEMFEHLLNLCENNDCDMSICGWYVVDGDNVRKSHFNSKLKIMTTEEAIDMLLDHFSFDNFSCNKLFKKKLFNDVEYPNGIIFEDLLVIYKLINNSKKIAADSTPLYYYVQHNNSITNNLQKHLNVTAFESFVIRKNDLLQLYPKLKNKIRSNFFTANKMYFMISLNSDNRNKKFEKERIKLMRKNVIYVWIDKSIPFRVKISSTLIAVFPYLYFKVRK